MIFSARIIRLAAIAGIAAVVVPTVFLLAGARINTTPSIPLGLYWKSDQPAGKGAYVLFCPPPHGAFAVAKDRGYITGGPCPGDYSYMMKKILAAKGDVVAVEASGVRVNGLTLPHSARVEADPAGRPMPRSRDHYTLGASEVLLMSDVNDVSFDGRYFGPVDRSQIVTVIRPVVVW